MSYRVVNSLVVAAGLLVTAGCGGGEPSASNSLENMTPEQRSQQMQQTMDTMNTANQKVFQEQGMPTPPAGAGFQPPESMKQYMNRGAGGAGATPPSSTPPTPPQ